MFEAPSLSIEWDAEARSVMLQWKRSVRGEPFRSGMDEGLRLLEWMRAERMLTDLRDIGTIAPATLRWVQRDWIPRAVVAGLRKLASIHPRKAIARRGVQRVMGADQGGQLEMESFDTPEQARAWLRSL
jgi:hypothetical protein